MAADRIAVLGAGSVGCFIGGAWAVAGLPVTFIGRPKIAADIAEHGLTLTDFTGWQAHLAESITAPIRRPLADADIIALTVKSGATADAAGEIAEHGREGALVISFQNGISNVEVLRGALGQRFEVVRGMVPYNCRLSGRGALSQRRCGRLALCGESPEDARTCERISAKDRRRCKLSDDMLGIAWGKLLINLNNAVNALVGPASARGDSKQRDYRRVSLPRCAKGCAS